MQKDWKNPLLFLFSREWRYSDSKMTLIGIWTIFIISESLVMFFHPFIMARIINIVQVRGINQGSLLELFQLLGASLVLIIVSWALHGPARVMQVFNSCKIWGKYLKYLTGGVVTLPMEWHNENHSGDTIDKIQKGTNALHDFSESSFEIIYAFVRLIASYGVLVYFSHSAAYIVLAMLLVGMLITMMFDKILIKNYNKINKAENLIAEGVLEAISNITTVIILRIEESVLSAVSKQIDEPRNLQLINAKINELKWFLVQLACGIMKVLVLGMYFWKVSTTNQVVVVSSVYLLISYLDTISGLFFQFAGQYGDVIKRRARVANCEVLTTDFREVSFSNHVLAPDWKNLSISNLNFTYAGGKQGTIHLRDVSLEIKRGQKIGFVGKRGSGKTTCLLVMMDLYKQESLTLASDGVEIPDGFSGINRALALIPQAPEIFASTIRRNITFGAPVSDEVIKRYTDMACFSDVIPGLPKGLESVTKEKGVKLSVGQRQCLALARGLLACENRDIILLDEPTSSMDPITAWTVFQNIFREMHGKTIISTVHTRDLFQLFDVLYVFDEGRIVGKGTVPELLETCPAFQRLYTATDVIGKN